eukprot:gene11771-14920_t
MLEAVRACNGGYVFLKPRVLSKTQHFGTNGDDHIAPAGAVTVGAVTRSHPRGLGPVRIPFSKLAPGWLQVGSGCLPPYTFPIERSASPMAGQPVTLEPLDANLELDFSEDRCSCQRMPGPPAVGYLFSGARANTGLASGKCYFSVKLGQPMPVNVPSTPPGEPGLRTGFQARVGISRGDTPVNLLGECQNSWAFSSSGRRLSSDGPAAYAAEGFGPGDCITVFVDLSQEPGIISFARNGYLLGLAFSVPYPQTKHEAYYPHILVKNISIECDFQGILPSNRPLSLSEDFNGYEPWMRANRALTKTVVPRANRAPNKAVVPRANRAPNKAMVPVRAVKPGKSPWLLMMVGLPGSGKTTKAREVAIKKADRRYIMLGIAPLLEQMRVRTGDGGQGGMLLGIAPLLEQMRMRVRNGDWGQGAMLLGIAPLLEQMRVRTGDGGQGAMLLGIAPLPEHMRVRTSDGGQGSMLLGIAPLLDQMRVRTSDGGQGAMLLGIAPLLDQMRVRTSDGGQGAMLLGIAPLLDQMRVRTSDGGQGTMLLGIAPLLEHLVVSSGRNPLYMDTDQKLMDAWNELLEALINRAVTLPRNYILDQSNVMSGPRWNKLSAFRAAGFHTEAMVLVVPDHVLYERQHLQFQAENKVVPDEAMASLKEGPGKEADRVLFVEQSREEARRTVDLQRQLGNAWLYWHANHLATKATPRPNHAAALADAEGAGDSPDGVASVARPCSPYDPMDVDVDKKDAREAADEPQGSVDSEEQKQEQEKGQEQEEEQEQAQEQEQKQESMADDDSELLTVPVLPSSLSVAVQSLADDTEGIPANWYWLEDKAVFKYWDGKEYTGESMTSEQLYADPVLSKQVLAYGSMLDDTEEEQPEQPVSNSGKQGQPPPSADDEYEHRLKIIKQKLDRGHSQH